LQLEEFDDTIVNVLFDMLVEKGLRHGSSCRTADNDSGSTVETKKIASKRNFRSGYREKALSEEQVGG
jgi:hypothetical protein